MTIGLWRLATLSRPPTSSALTPLLEMNSTRGRPDDPRGQVAGESGERPHPGSLCRKIDVIGYEITMLRSRIEDYPGRRTVQPPCRQGPSASDPAAAVVLCHIPLPAPTSTKFGLSRVPYAILVTKLPVGAEVGQSEIDRSDGRSLGRRSACPE